MIRRCLEFPKRVRPFGFGWVIVLRIKSLMSRIRKLCLLEEEFVVLSVVLINRVIRRCGIAQHEIIMLTPSAIHKWTSFENRVLSNLTVLLSQTHTARRIIPVQIG